MTIAITVNNPQEAKIAIESLTPYSNYVEDEKPVVKETKKRPAVKKEPVEEKETETKKRPAVKKEPVEEKSDNTISLKELTLIAKEAVSRSDRTTVKDAIAAYGDRLSSVDEAYYEDLVNDLKAL